MENNLQTSDILVIGAGMSGLTTALEAAETGYKVTLLEKRPYIGGRVVQLSQYFPKMCPPTCGIEINIQRLKKSKNIDLRTLAEVESIEGEPGNYVVKFKVKPRYIKEDCPEDKIEKYAEEISLERKNEYNYDLDKTKVLYLPYNNCYPNKWVFDREACTPDEAQMLADTYNDCIDLEQKEEIIEMRFKSVVWATGWKPYDANKLEHLGYKEYPGVINNVEMERFASPSGPTNGKIQIPGTDKDIESIAFVQCAGSRDENHLEYCSSICCLASMKQARYVREQYPDAKIHIFYIDLRAYGIMEDYYRETAKDENTFFHRGKVAKVKQEHGHDKYIVEAEDTLAGELNQAEVDMVVLATGMQPVAAEIPAFDKKQLDRNGFIKANGNGIIGCGVCVQPKDVAQIVREGTGAAIKAIHTIKRSK